VAADVPLFSIRGQVPSLLRPPVGCAFAPRCDRAMAECDRAAPPQYAVGADHQAACFLHRGTAEQTMDH
jgi:oligopeptide/dipeptide ABC transporter ATP-binding protein